MIRAVRCAVGAGVELRARVCHLENVNVPAVRHVRRTDFCADAQLQLAPPAPPRGWVRIGPQVTSFLPSLFPRQRPENQVPRVAAQLAYGVLQDRLEAHAARLPRQHVSRHVRHLYEHAGVRAAEPCLASTCGMMRPADAPHVRLEAPLRCLALDVLVEPQAQEQTTGANRFSNPSAMSRVNCIGAGSTIWPLNGLALLFTIKTPTRIPSRSPIFKTAAFMASLIL